MFLMAVQQFHIDIHLFDLTKMNYFLLLNITTNIAEQYLLIVMRIYMYLAILLEK